MREKHRRNHSRGASGENPRQNHSQRASGEKHEVKKQGYEDSEKNTKFWSDDEKNREEQSHQQAEEQSPRQATQTKGPRTRQDELRGEAQYRGKLQPASPEASKNRYRCPAGAMRDEAWRNDRDRPKDRLRRGNRGVQENHPDSSEASTQKVRKIVMDSLRSAIVNIVMDSFSLKAEDR